MNDSLTRLERKLDQQRLFSAIEAALLLAILWKVW